MKNIKTVFIYCLTLSLAVFGLATITTTATAKTTTHRHNIKIVKHHSHHVKKHVTKKHPKQVHQGKPHHKIHDSSIVPINANAKEDIQLPNGDDAPWKTIDGQTVTQVTQNQQITYAFDTSNGSDSNLINAYRAAINHWNNLNVIHLTQVDDPNQAEIKLIANYKFAVDPNTNQTITDPDVNGLTAQLQNNGQFTYTQIDLTPEIEQQSFDYQTQVAEHELGHALGFEHINGDVGINTTIMNETEDENSSDVDDSDVAPYFKQALQAHYPNNF